MIGLEYILNLNKLAQQELADELGIRKQNISRWVSNERSIPKKYLSGLSVRFDMPVEYFNKELEQTDMAKLNILFKENNQTTVGVEDYKKLLTEEISANIINIVKDYDIETLKYIKLITSSLDKDKLNNSLKDLLGCFKI